MSEITFEDFLHMTVNNLQNFLSVRGISTSGYRKSELVTRAFSVHEMNLSILESTEEQNKVRKEDYRKKLADLKLQDSKQIFSSTLNSLPLPPKGTCSFNRP